MPTYAYACTECGHEFDAVQSFSEDSLTDCPVCQGRLRKKFGAVGVVFKGSGFYRNDSRNGSGAVPAGSGGGSSDSSSSSSSEGAAPAKKAEPAAASSSGSSGSGSSGSASAGSSGSSNGSSGSASSSKASSGSSAA